MRLLYIGKARGDAVVTGVGRRAPKSRAMHAAMVIAVGFALIILAGTLLLMLPCAAKSGRATPFIDALFTATSATCVTGLVTVGTAVHWSLFGKCVILLLIQIGGLGFFVWSDVWDHRRFRSLSLHSKLVLAMSGVLLGGGFLLTLLFEWSNPATLGGMTLPHKLLAAAFQSVTLRTAGFNTIDESALTGPSQAVACVLMLIGGSPGSTAGGLKTVTVAVLALSAVSALRGRTSVTAFGRTIEPRSIMNAVALTVIGVTISLGGACVIAFIENAPMNLCLYETASAFGTVGLTMSLTPSLSAVSHIMLIVLMYFGRVGVLTLGVAVFLRRSEPPKLKFPSGNVMIG